MGLENLPNIDVEHEAGVRGRHAARGAHERPAAAMVEAVPEGHSGEPSLNSNLPASRKSVYARAAVIVACALALVGVGVAMAVVGARQAESEAEVPLMPETVQATVKADNVLIPGPDVQRGDEIENVVPASELTGVYADAYYRATLNGQTVYVAKSAVRTSDEAAPEQWVGYAAQDAIIFAKPDFSGEDILTLQLNEEVTVLDAFGDKLFVRNADGYEGYMPADKVMREKVVEEQPVASAGTSSSKKSGSSGSSSSSNSGSSSSGSSGSSSGGSSGSSGSGSSGSGSSGGGSDSGSSGSTDGDNMGMPASLSLEAAAASVFGVGVAYADEPAESLEVEDSEHSGLTAVVLADDTATYLGLLNRGDAVTVKVDELYGFTDRALVEGSALAVADSVSAVDSSDASDADDQASSSVDFSQLADDEKDMLGETEDLCTVVLNGQETTMPEKLLRLEDELPYEQWTGYAAEGAVLYSDYLLSAGATPLEVNAPLAVVDEVGTTLVVQMESGVLCIDSALVGREPVEVVEEVDDADAASDAGSSSGSSSGSTSSKKSSSSSGSSSGSGGSGSGDSGSSGSSGSSSGGSSASGSGGSSSGGDSGSSSDGGSAGSDEGAIIL